MNFQELELHPHLLRAVEKRGYTSTTPIQEQAIPVALQGRDILGCAQTGTGKTAAFALPLLHRLLKAAPSPSVTTSESNTADAAEARSTSRAPRQTRGIRALILVPTRELAVQVGESFATYGKGTGLRHMTIFGGVSQHHQVQTLRRGVDIVVATPGRLLDLVSQGWVKLDQVQTLVLDEADQMFDMGFIRDVRKIIRQLPRQRQTMLFSATLPTEIRKLAQECLRDPVSISATPATMTPAKIEQHVFYVEADQKLPSLIDFLQDHRGQKTLVFCRTKHGADKIVRRLNGADIEAVAIHGNKSQNARQSALRAFNTPQPPVLVATDVAARGLHIPAVNIVVNYELSDTPETYVHRIGRTARAEAEGRAVTFCDSEERFLLRRIEFLTKVRLTVVGGSPESEDDSREPSRTKRSGGSTSGKRSPKNVRKSHGGWNAKRSRNSNSPKRRSFQRV